MKIPRNKMICRLRDRAGYDTVIIEPVAASDVVGHDPGSFSSHPFVVRSGPLQNESTGSFWEIELEDEKNSTPRAHHIDASNPFSKSVSSKNLYSSVSLPTVQVPVSDTNSPRLVRTFRKLVVALPSCDKSDKPAFLLRFDGIAAPAGIEVDFIGIDKNRYVRRDALELRAGRLFMTNQRLARFPIFALSGKHLDVVVSGATLKVFTEGPITEEHPIDIRTAAEKDQALRDLLERRATSQRLNEEDRVVLSRAAELVGILSSGSLDADEIDVAKATIAGIADRTPIIEAIPALLSEDPAFADEMRILVDQARHRALAELETEFAAPRKEAEIELSVARETLEALKRETSLASERLRGFNESAASAKAEFKNDLEEAVIQFLGESAIDLSDRVAALEGAAKIGDDQVFEPRLVVESLITDDRLIERIALAVRAQGTIEISKVTASRPRAEDESGRINSLRAWAYEAGIPFASLVAILGVSVSGRVPMLYGPGADQAAEAVCKAVGGDGGFASVYCDPTLVSLGDLVGRKNDFFTPLKDAIETAKTSPDLLVPILLRNINYAPCQFWLSAISNRGVVTPIPKNMIILATLATDDARVGIPEGQWTHLVPLAVDRLPTESQKAVKPELAAFRSLRWPYCSPIEGPFPPELTKALLRVARKACGTTFNAEIAQEADTLLKAICGYLDLLPEDVEQAFEAPLLWKRRTDLAEDETIMRAIKILKG